MSDDFWKHMNELEEDRKLPYWRRKHRRKLRYYVFDFTRKWNRKIGPRGFKLRSQRVKKGYNYEDVWDFDHYLSGVIASGVKELHDMAHGWPGEPMTFEEWQEILKKIYTAYDRHARTWSDPWDTWREEDEFLQGEFKEAQELFTKYYLHLWD